MAASMDVLVDDLATLTKLDEQIMVDQLHRRYDDDKIYVRCQLAHSRTASGRHCVAAVH